MKQGMLWLTSQENNQPKPTNKDFGGITVATSVFHILCMAEWPSHSQVNKFSFSLFSYEKYKQSQILSLKPQISFKAKSRLIKFTSSHKFFQPQVQKWIPISKKLSTSTGLIKLIIKKVFHAIFIYPSISCQLSTPGSQVLVEPNQAVIGRFWTGSQSIAGLSN